jgi:hypothetical protein
MSDTEATATPASKPILIVDPDDCRDASLLLIPAFREKLDAIERILQGDDWKRFFPKRSDIGSLQIQLNIDLTFFAEVLADAVKCGGGSEQKRGPIFNLTQPSSSRGSTPEN